MGANFDVTNMYNRVWVRDWGNFRDWYCPFCKRWAVGVETKNDDGSIEMNCPNCNRLLVYDGIEFTLR